MAMNQDCTLVVAHTQARVIVNVSGAVQHVSAVAIALTSAIRISALERTHDCRKIRPPVMVYLPNVHRRLPHSVCAGCGPQRGHQVTRCPDMTLLAFGLIGPQAPNCRPSPIVQPNLRSARLRT